MGISIQGMGGGGAASVSDVYANLPAASSAGRLFVPQDGFYDVLRDTGSAWQYFVGQHKVTLPVLGDFTARNSASAATSKGAVLLTVPASAVVSVRAYTKAVSGNHTVVAAIIPTYLGIDFTDTCGLCWFDGTKYVTFGVGYSATVTGGYYLLAAKWTNATTFLANYIGVSYSLFGSRVVWLRIRDDGANRYCEFSNDGENYFVFHSVGRTDFMTATEIGFAGSAQNATFGAYLNVLSWDQT